MGKRQQAGNGLALAVVSAVFFLWGFLTCLNDILIPHLKALFTLSYAQSALVQLTFFGAYFVFSLPAGKVMGRIGYQKSISLGLLIGAVGALAFFPAAHFASFPFFLAALFVLAAGITFLQVAANPFVTMLGPEGTASSRLTMAQALNALGTTVAPLFGSILILSATVLKPDELSAKSKEEQAAYQLMQAHSVQGPYLFLAGVLIALSAFVYFFRLPSFPREKSASESARGESKIRRVLAQPHVVFGVIALFLYVGAEVSIGSFLINFISQPTIGALTQTEAAHYVTFYWGGAMAGRFLGALLLRRIDAGRLLGTFALVAGGLVLLTIFGHGPLAAATIVAVGLFNSIMFPTIFSLGIRGLGSLTEEASSLLIMAVVGGALVPLLQGVLADRIGLQTAFFLPVLCYGFIAFYGFRGSRTR